MEYQIFVGERYINYENILPKTESFNIFSRWRHLDAAFLINVLKIKLVVLHAILILSVYAILGYLENYSKCIVNHNFKVSPSDNCVSVANVICKDKF
jgi:hypothetical protein